MQATCREAKAVVEKLEAQILLKCEKHRGRIEAWEKRYEGAEEERAESSEVYLPIFEDCLERIVAMKGQCGASLESALKGEEAYLDQQQHEKSFPHASGGPNYPPSHRMKVNRARMQEAFYSCWLEVFEACCELGILTYADPFEPATPIKPELVTMVW